MRRTRVAGLVVTLVAPLGVSGCGGQPPAIGLSGIDGLEIPTASPNPSDFVSEVDNPWFPLAPGTVRTYDVTGHGTGQRTETVTVTDDTRLVAGVRTTVVHDALTRADGTVLEDADEWFAQDAGGNVWSFGRETTQDDRGTPGDPGSWEAGVEGAEAGLVMAAQPRVGDGYQQERADHVAQNRAEVLSLSEQRSVPAGVFGGLVETEDTTALEPALVERTFYAEGLGIVLEETVAGGDDLVQLTSVTTP